MTDVHAGVGAESDDPDPTNGGSTMQKGGDTSTTPSKRPSRAQRFIRLACRAYLLFTLAVWALIALGADRWWLGTAAMFGPVWAWALPLAPLIPLASIRQPRSLLTLALALLVILFPIGRLCISAKRLLPSPAGTPLKVITLNADHRDLDPTAFAQLVQHHQPDLVILQGWRSRYEKTVFAHGWHLRRDDELCLASRHPITAARPYPGREFKDHPGTLATYDVATPAGPVHVVNFHLATPRDGLSALILRAWRSGAAALTTNTNARRQQSLAARRIAESLPGSRGAPLIIAGDFNTPTTSALYRECWSDFTNAFSAAGWGLGHTHFSRRIGVRIDHILASDGWRVTRCEVGPDVGSAHRPVIAELRWVH